MSTTSSKVVRSDTVDATATTSNTNVTSRLTANEPQYDQIREKICGCDKSNRGHLSIPDKDNNENNNGNVRTFHSHTNHNKDLLAVSVREINQDNRDRCDFKNQQCYIVKDPELVTSTVVGEVQEQQKLQRLQQTNCRTFWGLVCWIILIFGLIIVVIVLLGTLVIWKDKGSPTASTPSTSLSFLRLKYCRGSRRWCCVFCTF